MSLRENNMTAVPAELLGLSDISRFMSLEFCILSCTYDPITIEITIGSPEGDGL